MITQREIVLVNVMTISQSAQECFSLSTAPTGVGERRMELFSGGKIIKIFSY